MIGSVVSNILLSGLPVICLALGVWLMLRVLGEFDLSVDALYTTGAAVSGMVVLGGGSPWLALALAFVAGAVAAGLSMLMHVTLKVPLLLATLIMLTGLYSINLHILGGSTINLIGSATIFEPFGEGRTVKIVVLAVLVGAVALALYLFLNTRFGLGLRAGGVNARMSRSFGVNTRLTLLVGLILSEALAAVGGALQAQVQGYADINMGVGSIIIGASAILLGELFFRNGKVLAGIIGVVVGSLLYEAVLVFALRSGLPPQDLKLVTAGILVVAMLAQAAPERVRQVGRRAQGLLGRAGGGTVLPADQREGTTHG